MTIRISLIHFIPTHLASTSGICIGSFRGMVDRGAPAGSTKLVQKGQENHRHKSKDEKRSVNRMDRTILLLSLSLGRVSRLSQGSLTLPKFKTFLGVLE